MMRGNWTFRRPAFTCWMVKPAPQVMTRATASPGPATGSGRSTRSNGRFGPFSTIAFMQASPFNLSGTQASHSDFKGGSGADE